MHVYSMHRQPPEDHLGQNMEINEQASAETTPSMTSKVVLGPVLFAAGQVHGLGFRV